jgi:hypothetical protein
MLPSVRHLFDLPFIVDMKACRLIYLQRPSVHSTKLLLPKNAASLPHLVGSVAALAIVTACRSLYSRQVLPGQSIGCWLIPSLNWSSVRLLTKGRKKPRLISDAAPLRLVERIRFSDRANERMVASPSVGQSMLSQPRRSTRSSDQSW